MLTYGYAGAYLSITIPYQIFALEILIYFVNYSKNQWQSCGNQEYFGQMKSLKMEHE